MMAKIGPNNVVDAAIWSSARLPKINCIQGREAFFKMAPFEPRGAVPILQLDRRNLFFRAVLGKEDAIKFYESHGSKGDIISATLYSNNITGSEKSAITAALESSGIPYEVVSSGPEEIKIEEFKPGRGKIAETIEHFGPGREGERTITLPEGVRHSYRVTNILGQTLVNEVFDDNGNLLDVEDERFAFNRHKCFAPSDKIKTGISLEFNTDEELAALPKRHYGRVELNLPFRMGQYKKVVSGQLRKVINTLKGSDLEIGTLHAPHGPISTSWFRNWGREVMHLADALGASTVTFHPSNLNESERAEEARQRALRMMREVQGNYRAVMAFETFAGRRRLFGPADLVRNRIPMVLDMSHVRYEEGDRLMTENSGLIRTVHLSSQGTKEHHLPFDRPCLDLLEEAISANWSGSVVLEYLPKYRELLPIDQRRIERFLAVAEEKEE